MKTKRAPRLYPVIFNGQSYPKNKCDELFTCYYHCKEALDFDGYVYAYDGMWIAPNGKIIYK